MPALLFITAAHLSGPRIVPRIDVDHPYRESERWERVVGERHEPIWVELGDGVEGFTIRVLPGRDSYELKAEQRFLTSMALSEEGPHLDLVGWKHHVSQYWQLSSQPDGSFVPTKIDHAQSTRFPPYSPAELEAAIESSGGAKWLEAWQSGRAGTYVALSHVEVRISAKVDGSWKVIDVVRFRVPLGC